MAALSCCMTEDDEKSCDEKSYDSGGGTVWDNFEGGDCGIRNPGSQMGFMVVIDNCLSLQKRKRGRISRDRKISENCHEHFIAC